MVISYNWAGKLLVDDPLLPTLSRSGPPLPVSSWLRGLPWIFLKVAGNVILNWPVRMSSTKLSNWSTLSLTWDLETVAPSHMPNQRWNLPLTAHMNLATNRSSNGMWSLNVFLLHPIVMRSCLRLVEQTLSSPKKISHLAENRLKLSSHAVEVSWYVNCLFQWIFYFDEWFLLTLSLNQLTDQVIVLMGVREWLLLVKHDYCEVAWSAGIRVKEIANKQGLCRALCKTNIKETQFLKLMD